MVAPHWARFGIEVTTNNVPTICSFGAVFSNAAPALGARFGLDPARDEEGNWTGDYVRLRFIALASGPRYRVKNIRPPTAISVRANTRRSQTSGISCAPTAPK